MKPIYLKMTAFGSYCGTAEVDFTKLYDNGLFLITGKTGGGKTTILDAMCVALYGKATGSERAKDWKQLRCGSAPSSVDTELEYQFGLGGKQYRFCRRWHLPNARKGEPLLKDAESACYCRQEGDENWKLITSGKSGAVNETAESILKLTQAQFVKVIMLPQGEFRELLTASSDEKEAIFKKLFDTERWERITDRIAEEYRRIDKLCSEHTHSRDISLQAAECANAEELQGRITQTKADLQALEAKAQENNQKMTTAAAALKAGEETAGLFAEWEQQRGTLQRLTVDAARFTAMEERLQHSRKLRGVLPQYQMMKAAQATAVNSEKIVTQAEQAQNAAQKNWEQAQKNAVSLSDLEQQKGALQAAVSSLSELAQSRVAYDEAQRKRETGERSYQAEETRLAGFRKDKADMEESIAKGNAFLEECHAATAALNGAVETSHRLEQQFRLTAEWEEKSARLKELAQQIEQAESRIANCEQDCESARAIAAAVEQAIMNDKAYSLASTLSEDAPCPVCGSVHHPKLAHPSENTPTAAEREKCKKAQEICDKALEQARTDYSSLLTEHNVLWQTMEPLREELGGSMERPSSEIKTEWDTAEQRVQALRKLSGKTAKAQAKLGELQNRLTANTHDIEATNTNLNNLKIQITSAKQTVDSLTERLQAKGIADFALLDQKLTQAQRELRTIEAQIKGLQDALADASTQYSAAQATYKAAQERMTAAYADQETRETEYRTKCAELNIAANTDIEGGVLPENVEAEHEQQLNAYYQQLHFARTRATELATRLEGKQPPALDSLRAANAAAIEEGQEIARQIGNVHTRLQFLQDTADTVAREEGLLAKLQEQYAAAARMNYLLSGRNEAGVPIHQYVIGIKMDEVILSANLYLTKLTKGQYAMKRKETKSGRARHQGLDIEIVDSAAGRERPVATLSGGELFLASLSLAFGLSDVVQSFAGGIHLDSLFIDEGFGSLDSETLDTAMDAITQVRENKLLGIISHVSELKERIPYGIEVVKTYDGSTLKMRV